MKRRAGDTLGRLYAVYHRLNEQHFGGLLTALPIYLQPASKRQADAKTQEWAHVWTDDFTGAPRYIEFASPWVLTAGWGAVLDTVAHEMIHVWQAQLGRRVVHDSRFRYMARRMGVSGRACEP